MLADHVVGGAIAVDQDQPTLGLCAPVGHQQGLGPVVVLGGRCRAVERVQPGVGHPAGLAEQHRDAGALVTSDQGAAHHRPGRKLPRERRREGQGAVDLHVAQVLHLFDAVLEPRRLGPAGHVLDGDGPRIQVSRPAGVDGHAVCAQHRGARQALAAAVQHLAVGEGGRADGAGVAEHHIAALAEDGYAAVLGQAHRVHADHIGVERQVGVAHRVVPDGVGKHRHGLENLAVFAHGVGAVPDFGLIACSHHPSSKAAARHAGLVVKGADHVGARDVAIQVGRHVDLAALQPRGQQLEAARLDRRHRGAEGGLVHRAAVNGGQQ